MKFQAWWVLVLGFLVVALAHPEQDQQDVESNLEEKNHSKRAANYRKSHKHTHVDVKNKHDKRHKGHGKDKKNGHHGKSKTVHKSKLIFGGGQGYSYGHYGNDVHHHQEYIPAYAGHLYNPNGVNFYEYNHPYVHGGPVVNYGGYHGYYGGNAGHHEENRGYQSEHGNVHHGRPQHDHHYIHHSDHHKKHHGKHGKKHEYKEKSWLKLPFIVKVKVPVKVPKPYPVYVPEPYPVTVLKPVPYPVVKKIPYPVEVPVHQEPLPLAHPQHQQQQQQQQQQVLGQASHQAYNVDPRLLGHSQGIRGFA